MERTVRWIRLGVRCCCSVGESRRPRSPTSEFYKVYVAAVSIEAVFFFFFFLQLWNFTSEVLFKSVALPFFPSVTFYFISISIFYFYFYLYFSNFIINISGKKFKIRRERTCFRIFLSSGRVYSPTGPLRYDNFAL